MSKRILVVDDDPGVLEALTIMLQTWDYEVKGVSRGEVVFSEVSEFMPNLILMDVMLSGMDGRNICKALKATPHLADIPVIMISAHVNAYTTMFDAGAPNDFVPKPFDMHYLLNKIERQLAA